MISYLVTVCNENEEVRSLLDSLMNSIDLNENEVIVLFDSKNGTEKVLNTLEEYEDKVTVVKHPFEGDFAKFKNYGNKQCSKEWIMQLDADEYLDNWLISILPDICQANPTVDLFWFPRANTVDGITLKHLEEWRWQVQKSELSITAKELNKESEELMFLRNYDFIISENDSPTGSDFSLVTYYAPLVNFPDWQGRLYRNRKDIEWKGKVHEKVEGARHFSYLPSDYIYSIIHPKTIERQEKQNKLYANLR